MGFCIALNPFLPLVLWLTFKTCDQVFINSTALRFCADDFIQRHKNIFVTLMHIIPIPIRATEVAVVMCGQRLVICRRNASIHPSVN